MPCWINESDAEHYVGWELHFKSCQLANYKKMETYGNVDVEEVHTILVENLGEVKTKMVKVSELSNFVVAGVDIKTGDVLTFTTPGVLRSAEETPFGREVFQIGVKLPNGSEKTLTMNRTSIRNVAKEYGDETKEWVGKEAVVTLVKQMVRDNMKDVIYLNPLQKTLKKKQAQQESES